MKTEITRPCGALYLKRNGTEKSVFYVCGKEGEIIPDLCGQLSEGQEFLILVADFENDWEGITFSLCSINPNVFGTHTGEYYQGEEVLQIARFNLTSEHRGAVKYKNYALLLEFNSNFNSLSIKFYEGLGNYAPNLLMILEQGLLKDRVA